MNGLPRKDRSGMYVPLCVSCKNRKNLGVCRNAMKTGSHTIEECEGYVEEVFYVRRGNR